ncbi:MAG: hypothetical protein ACRCZK_00965 [Oscillospiraceae bacterium]
MKYFKILLALNVFMVIIVSIIVEMLDLTEVYYINDFFELYLILLPILIISAIITCTFFVNDKIKDLKEEIKTLKKDNIIKE